MLSNPYDYRVIEEGGAFRALIFRSGHLTFTRRFRTQNAARLFAADYTQHEWFRTAVRKGSEAAVR